MERRCFYQFYRSSRGFVSPVEIEICIKIDILEMLARGLPSDTIIKALFWANFTPAQGEFFIIILIVTFANNYILFVCPPCSLFRLTRCGGWRYRRRRGRSFSCFPLCFRSLHRHRHLATERKQEQNSSVTSCDGAKERQGQD
jgi:hypothetical protein